MEYYRGISWPRRLQGPDRGRAAWDDVRVPVSSLGDRSGRVRFQSGGGVDRSTIRLFWTAVMNDVDLART